MPPDTQKPRPGLCGLRCASLSQEETVFSCTQDQGSECKKHGGMDGARHAAESCQDGRAAEFSGGVKTKPAEGGEPSLPG